jgi:hypothetical protein
VRQQINLYQPIFSEQRKPLSALTIGIGLLVMVLVLAGIAVNASLAVEKLELELESLQAQQAEQQSLFGTEPAESLETVQVRVKQLDRLVNERGRALQVLQSGGAGTTVGFAPRLEALARRHIDGLWIDSMSLSGANGAMTLAGASFNPDLVPTYLGSLAQDKVLSGTRFDDFIIERPVAQAQAEDGATEEGAAKPKQVDPRLIRFRAGSSALKAKESST